jgi:hypothetical protein
VVRRFLIGIVAGAAGTTAMTALQELLSHLKGEEGESDEEPAPAQVARRMLAVAGIDPPPSWTPWLTQLAHWSYGIGWGGAYGLVRRRHDHALPTGLGFGLGVWASSYAQLVPLGIYEPPWAYPAREIAEDLSYHVVYGLGVAATYAALER